MDAVDAIYGRRSIRDFTEAEIPREEVEALIEAAIQAPNGVNLQPWSFVVAGGRARPSADRQTSAGSRRGVLRA